MNVMIFLLMLTTHMVYANLSTKTKIKIVYGKVKPILKIGTVIIGSSILLIVILTFIVGLMLQSSY